MDQDTYDSMIRKRDNVDYSWEKRVSAYTIDDVNEDAFFEYLRKAKEAGRIDFEDTDVKTVLDKLELIEGNYLLNAGAALFCDCMDWRVEFGNLTRKEIPEIPLDAIREAITNSFGHRMFDSGQSNEMTIFKNRIEIYNPGAFPANKTPESYVMGNQRPIRRNPLIARTLYYSKDMESFATGLKRIKDACDKAGCKVEFETPDDGFVVIFYRHGIEKLSGTAQKEEKTAQKTAQKEERINALLEYCKKPRNRDEMMKFLGIKHRTTFRNDYLNPLLDEGKIAMTIPDKPRSKKQKFYSL